MEAVWENYLEILFPLDHITDLVIYTDHYRFWLTSGLLDLADRLGWQSSLQILEEITDEEGMEVRQSMGALSDSTLLTVFFSDRNPIITELFNIFPLLHPPMGFQGLSLISHHSLPDQYFVNHLQTDFFKAKELEVQMRQYFRETFIVETNDYNLEAHILSVASYPYMDRKHVVLPSTELILELELGTVQGMVLVTDTIGAVFEQEELIDPFGLLEQPIQLLIEDGQITDIRGDRLTRDRIQEIFSIPTSFDRIQLSIGLGPESSPTGFIEHDRLLHRHLTLSWYDETKEAHFECVIGILPSTTE